MLDAVLRYFRKPRPGEQPEVQSKEPPEELPPDLTDKAVVMRSIEAILARNHRLEVSQPWPDTPEALAELATIAGIAEYLAKSVSDGRVFLLQFEKVLAARLRDYNSEAEYASDKGRLGNVLQDVRKLMDESGVFVRVDE